MESDVRKAYVKVEAWFGEDGSVHPTCIVWKDGDRYEVDAVTDIRPGVSLKTGGAGLRYTVRISGQSTFLYQEGTKWFVEQKVPVYVMKLPNEKSGTKEVQEHEAYSH